MMRGLAIAAGACAIASGAAYLLYWPILDQPDWAITTWNLLIIPAALVLGVQVASRGPIVAAVATTAGVASSLLWSVGFENPRLEPWWIGLSAVWWLGVGWLLRDDHPRTGWFTLVLGVAAAVDFVVTALGFGLPLLAVGGFKLPLTTAWSVWIGVLLIRDATSASIQSVAD